MHRRCGVWDDRYHVRYWEFGDHVSMQAHFEERRSHDIISYEDAEDGIRGIFDDANWNVGSRYAYSLDNHQDPDHNGYASEITRW